MANEIKIFCFVLVLSLLEIQLSYACHDGGHSIKSSRPTFIRSSGSSPFQMTMAVQPPHLQVPQEVDIPLSFGSNMMKFKNKQLRGMENTLK